MYFVVVLVFIFVAVVDFIVVVVVVVVVVVFILLFSNLSLLNLKVGINQIFATNQPQYH